MLVGAPVPAITPVTGPAGVVLAPSAPILSLVNTFPVVAVAESSVAAPVSALAIGASSIMAIPKSFGGVTLLAESLRDTAKFSITVPPLLSGVFNVYL